MKLTIGEIILMSGMLFLIITFSFIFIAERNTVAEYVKAYNECTKNFRTTSSGTYEPIPEYKPLGDLNGNTTRNT